jgi:hypothetical protein
MGLRYRKAKLMLIVDKDNKHIDEQCDSRCISSVYTISIMIEIQTPTID